MAIATTLRFDPLSVQAEDLSPSFDALEVVAVFPFLQELSLKGDAGGLLCLLL